ncbi:MAG: hypothetical protein LC778_14580 [Acidobacteria bacterium]|nr:hypothetical protein [Acidobacteriota bacterium]
MNIKEQVSQEAFAALTDQERYFERITPRIEKLKFNEQLSCIFIRFVDNETPIAESLFYPIEAVWSFLDTARNYYKSPESKLTAEEIEKFAFNDSVNMFCIMLRNIYPRVAATLNSITDETINEWYRQEHQRHRAYCSRQGIITTDDEIFYKEIRNKIINDHSKEVKNVWEGEQKNFKNYQNMRFAEEYEKLSEHWDTISLLYRRKRDWLGYAKRDDFQDTPDDLLDEMKGSHHRGMSLKALEHSARRVGLINPDCIDEEILEKRKSGIQASGFCDSTLYTYLSEGKRLIEQLKEIQKTAPPEPKRLAE